MREPIHGTAKKAVQTALAVQTNLSNVESRCAAASFAASCIDKASIALYASSGCGMHGSFRGTRPAPKRSLHCATSSSNATPWVTNLAVLGTHHFQGIKQVFEGFHWSGAEVDRERDGAV